tara:strand:+ start:21506 stop:21730 length:225 start_codon:yes stop_codon:yes gene_type:complete
MKTVKLTAKPDTWFDEGTEVYDYGSDYENKVRITWLEFEEWKKSGMILARGLRNGKTDGEACGIDEFEVEIVEE